MRINMKKEEVQRILEICLHEIKKNLNISYDQFDISALTKKIWPKIQNSLKQKENAYVFPLTKSQIEKLIYDGNLLIRLTDLDTIHIYFEKQEVNTSILENGQIILWMDEETI
jgi:hypothetical protein